VLTAVVSIIVSTISAWLIFRFVKRAELATILQNEVTKFELVKKPEMAEALQNELRQQRQLLELEQQRDRESRIRQEILRWANPILAAVEDLSQRLKNILQRAGYPALDPKWNPKSIPNWAISHDYFMNSSLYLFAIYFAQTRQLRRELSFEFFSTQQEKDRLFDAIDKVATSLSSYPYQPIMGCSGRDAQVFRLQQRSLGELLIRPGTGVDNYSGHSAIVTYPEFLQCMKEGGDFATHFDPLKKLLEGVRPGDNCRWMRLEQTYQALQELDAVCRELLDLRRVDIAQL
jgi:hypothetical protein